jgi:tetratricopeptide (TPR) repeat protein
MALVRENDTLAREPTLPVSTRPNLSFSRIWGVLALTELGDFAEAFVRGKEALAVSSAEFGRHGDAWACLGIGRFHLVKGDIALAIKVLEHGLPLCEAGGDLEVYFSRTAASLGGAYALAGRFDEAVSVLERADRHAESLEFAYGHALVIATLAEAKLLAGDRDHAVRAAERALALSRQHGQRGWEAWTLRVLGDIAGADAAAEAATHYRAALGLASELGMRPLQAHCHRGLVHVTGSPDELATATDLYQAMDMTLWLDN